VRRPTTRSVHPRLPYRAVSVPDLATPVEVIVIGWCLPQNELLRRALDRQGSAAREEIRELATVLFVDDDEADQHLEDPGAWILRVLICPSAVMRERGLLAWTSVTR